MNYTQLFRTLREAKGLTHDGLAREAGCHRNTVINVESGRPVKFKTIAELMAKMGYGAESPELKSVALLWLEAISGVNFTQEESTREARTRIAGYRASEKETAQLLADAAISSHLTVDQMRTLLFAAGRPEVISVVEGIRQMVTAAETAPVVETNPPMKVDTEAEA